MKKAVLILSFVLFPVATHAEVLFSEIAWMGTESDANDEWIEIYNFSSSPTNLSGWTISDGGSLNIELSGTMQPHEVFLLERTDDNSVPNIPADIIYTGALSNSGATLTLKDGSGNVIETLVGGDAWEKIGGNNQYKLTAQRTMSGTWVTGSPTPKAPNVEVNETPDVANEEGKMTNTSGGGGGPAKRRVEETIHLHEIDHNLSVVIDSPDTVFVQEPVLFTVVPSGAGKTLMNSLKYFWNFGDTYTSNQNSPIHGYSFPGEYVVVVEAQFGEEFAQTTKIITVLPKRISISITESGDILLSNSASFDINIGEYTLEGVKKFLIPKNTILQAYGSLTISKERVIDTQTLTLSDTAGITVARNGVEENISNEIVYARANDSFQVSAVTTDVVNMSDSKSTTTSFVSIDDKQIITIGENTESIKAQDITDNDKRSTYGIGAILLVGIFLILYLRRS